MFTTAVSSLHHLFSPLSLHLLPPLLLHPSDSTSFVVTLLPASLLHHYLIQSSHLSFRLITLSSIPPSPIPSSLLPFYPSLIPPLSSFSAPFVPPSPTLSLSSLHYPLYPSILVSHFLLPSSIRYSSHPLSPYFSSLSLPLSLPLSPSPEVDSSVRSRPYLPPLFAPVYIIDRQGCFSSTIHQHHPFLLLPPPPHPSVTAAGSHYPETHREGEREGEKWGGSDGSSMGRWKASGAC